MKITKKWVAEKTPQALQILLGLLAIFLFINVLLSTVITTSIWSNKKIAAEAARPANLQITTILPENCANCFDIKTIITTLKTKNVNITQEKILKQSEAQMLIDTYHITQLPIVIVQGELTKITVPEFRKEKDALIYNQTEFPYFSIPTNTIKGRVTLTVIKPDDCTVCKDLTSFSQTLHKILTITSEKTLNEKDAQDLIQKFNIKSLPTIILSQDAQDYTDFTKKWLTLGTQETDGTFILRDTTPPFKDIPSGKIKGVTTITYITDKSCTTCYNVSIHRQILQDRLGVYIQRENSMDILSGEGKAALFTYNITKVPTVIISSELQDYVNIKDVLAGVGTIEKDGSFVFRGLDDLGVPYKDLTTGKIVEPKQQPAQ